MMDVVFVWFGRDRVTRQHYYFQLRENVLRHGQPATEESFFRLAALALQAELGDYEPERHRGAYFDPQLYFPQWVRLSLSLYLSLSLSLPPLPPLPLLPSLPPLPPLPPLPSPPKSLASPFPCSFFFCSFTSGPVWFFFHQFLRSISSSKRSTWFVVVLLMSRSFFIGLDFSSHHIV